MELKSSFVGSPTENAAHRIPGRTTVLQPVEKTLVLPYPISANRYWKIIRLGKGEKSRSLNAPTSEAKAYKQDVAYAAMAAKVKPLEGRVFVSIKLYPERPLDWQKRARLRPDDWDDSVRCIDLDNCSKVLHDALNGVAWHDDKQIRRIELERMEPDAHGARVVITFRAFEQVVTAPELPL